MGNSWENELAQLEQALQLVKDADTPKYPNQGEIISINPTLQLLALTWSNLCALLKDPTSQTVPEQGQEFVVLYRYPGDGEVFFYPASKANLLALKVLSENLDRKQVAEEADVAVGQVDAAIEEACKQGIVISPPSAIQRPDTHLPVIGAKEWHSHLSSNYFTLQWHVTQACDLHCKHCYDRSEISPLTLEQGITILDQFRDFVLAKKCTWPGNIYRREPALV